MTAGLRRRRCWCGRPVPRRHVPHGVIDCGEHDNRLSAPAPITHVMSPHPTIPRSGDRPPPSPDLGTTPKPCPACGDEGFLFHLFEGAVELDGPCPMCTPRQEAAA